MLTVRDLVRLLTLSAHSPSDQGMLTVRDLVRLLTLSAHSPSDQGVLTVRDLVSTLTIRSRYTTIRYLVSVFTLNVLWLSSAFHLDLRVNVFRKATKNA